MTSQDQFPPALPVATVDQRPDCHRSRVQWGFPHEPLTQCSCLSGHPTERIRQTPGRRLQELLKEPLLVSEFAFLRFQLFTLLADEFVLIIERRTVSGQSGNSSTRSRAISL